MQTITGLEREVVIEHVPGRPIRYERHPSGTYYHAQTSHALRQVLENARIGDTQVRIFHGHTDGERAGQDWLEEHDVRGTIARSIGPLKIPLLIRRGQSGGPALLDHCIVRVIDTSTRRELYRHGSYQVPELRIVQGGDDARPGLPVAVYRRDRGLEVIQARFKTMPSATRWVAFMRGERMAA